MDYNEEKLKAGTTLFSGNSPRYSSPNAKLDSHEERVSFSIMSLVTILQLLIVGGARHAFFGVFFLFLT